LGDNMTEHRIEMHYDKHAPASRAHWGVCSCGRWESGRVSTAGMVHGAHGEHVDAERAQEGS